MTIAYIVLSSSLYICSSEIHWRWHYARYKWLRLFLWGENVPKPQSLISCTCHQSLTVWRACKIENSKGMTRQSRQFFHSWIFPDYDLILTVTMSTNKLIGILAEHQIAYLTSCFEGTEWAESKCVPESDASISCAATTSQEAVLMRTPSYSFDCSHVIRELSLWCMAWVQAPQ